MDFPNITPTEHRNAALMAAFRSLDAILSSRFDLPSWGVGGVTEEGVYLNLVKNEYHGGDCDTSEETVFFLWGELIGMDGDKLGDLAETRWTEAGAARVAAAREERERKEFEARQRAAKAAEEAHAKKSENDRAKLRELMAAYPDEVKNALFTNLPTATP